MNIESLKKEKCTGCSACMNICPTGCISMKSDETGFLYPEIEKNRCVDCEGCVNVCPTMDKQKLCMPTGDVVYAAWSKDDKFRENSTSGGIFSELAMAVLRRSGYVVGAAYNERCDVVHAIINDESGLNKLRQSKYVQSEMGEIYKTLQEKLDEGECVLFCGTPCQCAGVKKYLKKDYEKLYLADFICRGVNSPKAYRAWLRELEEKHGSKAVRVWFKYKLHGWKKSPKCTRIDFANGQSCIQYGEDNSYMKGYLNKNLYIRPSCGRCDFKGAVRVSDITLGDFWGLSDENDDDKGISFVMINSEKGRELFEQCKDNIIYCRQDLEKAIKGNMHIEKPVEINPEGIKFLTELDKIPFSALMNQDTDRNELYLRVTSRWLENELKGEDTIERYFIDNSYSKIAIYGMGMLGADLFQKLSKNNNIDVVFYIDQNPNEYESVRTIKSSELQAADFYGIDCVVITPIHAKISIIKQLRSLFNGKIIGIDDILFL